MITAAGRKIVFVGHEASRTGAPRSLLNIAGIAVSQGYIVKFILGKSNNEGVLEEYRQLGEVFIWSKNKFSRLERVKNKLFKKPKYNNSKKILEAVQKFQPNLIFNNTIVNGAILEQLKQFNIPIVSRIPELESVIQKYNLNNKSSDKVIQYSSKIVAVSEAVKLNLIQNHRVTEDRIEVIYGFVKNVDTQPFFESRNLTRKELSIPEDAFIIGNCSSLIYRKGFDFFIELATIVNKITPIYFVWVGGKEDSELFLELQEEIKKKNIDNRVLFIGEQNNVNKYLAMMDVFFHSSREEPFSLSMLEAAQFRLPILAFKQTGGVEEFLAAGGGVLAEYGNINSLADSLVLMKNNTAVYTQFSNESYSNFSKYGETVTTKAWIQFLNNHTQTI